MLQECMSFFLIAAFNVVVEKKNSAINGERSVGDHQHYLKALK